MQKRLSRGACIQCGKKIPTGAASCPYCGTGQMMQCGSCEIPTPSAGAFCIHCGAALAKLDALAKMSQG
jgi:RNA polymerase subunit RPABC4/transcription elongation factor Spt4